MANKLALFITKDSLNAVRTLAKIVETQIETNFAVFLKKNEESKENLSQWEEAKEDEVDNTGKATLYKAIEEYLITDFHEP